jgi:hypothetical protein
LYVSNVSSQISEARVWSWIAGVWGAILIGPTPPVVFSLTNSCKRGCGLPSSLSVPLLEMLDLLLLLLIELALLEALLILRLAILPSLGGPNMNPSSGGSSSSGRYSSSLENPPRGLLR